MTERRISDSYETGSTLWFTDRNGIEREYVPRFVSESLIDIMRSKVNDYVAFGKAHGLTDEMYVEWKATGVPARAVPRSALRSRPLVRTVADAEDRSVRGRTL